MRRSPARVSRGPASTILHRVARANSSNFGKLFSQVAWKNHRPVREPYGRPRRRVFNGLGAIPR
jgi:hypothetical protein